MRGLNVVALTATLALAAFGEFAGPAGAQAPAVTAFEGARLIVGNGRPSIENATVVVEGTKITQAGAAVDVRVPEGAAQQSHLIQRKRVCLERDLIAGFESVIADGFSHHGGLG